MAWLRNSIKAPNPALNIKRRNEPVAMDTIYGPVGHPAIAHGSTHAQFFIGRISNYRSTYHCGKSDKDVHRCILDEIRRLGAMDVLVSDRAQAQISKKVHDVLRTFAIKDRQWNLTTRIRITQNVDGKTPNYFRTAYGHFRSSVFCVVSCIEICLHAVESRREGKP